MKLREHFSRSPLFFFCFFCPSLHSFGYNVNKTLYSSPQLYGLFILSKFHNISIFFSHQALECLPEVDTAVVGLHDSSRLVAFVVPTYKPRNISTEHKVYVHDNTEILEDSSSSSVSLEMTVLQRLSQLVPSYSIPDTVLLVPQLPLTNHGIIGLLVCL